MIDRQLVEQKLDRIRQYLTELEPYASMDYGAYLNSNEHYRTAERLLQLIVDAAVEVNAHLLVESGRAAPDDYHVSFTNLALLGVLEAVFAETIAKSAGLRNRLVHDYADVNALMVFESIPHALRDYRTYIERVLAFLDRLDSRTTT